MANSLITDRNIRYSFALLIVASLTCTGYYLYNNAAQEQNPLPAVKTGKNDAANNLFQQGNRLYKEGKYTEAIERYHEAIKLEPTHEQAHISTSLAAAKLGDTDHAIEHTQKALIINPNYIPGYVMMGNFQEDKGLFDEAKKSYEKALSLNANLYEGNIFMARLLLREEAKEATAQAIVHAQRAIAVQPHSKDSLITLGDCYFVSGQLTLAREQYQAMIDRYPQAYSAYVNLGKTYEHEQQIDKALPYYQKSVAIKADYAPGHVALANSHFIRGNLKEGFKEYEWRWLTSNMPNLPKKWDGSSVKDKTVVVLSENSAADIIQYVRFAKLLKDKGARVIVHTAKPLSLLFKLCDYIDQVIISGDTIPEYDFITSMQSIPFHLGIDRATLPTAAYLKADKKLVDSWHQRLSKDTGFKVGICLAPGIDLAALKSLTDSKKVTFYPLQKDGDLMDAAAAMKKMDLIISSDNAIAHLAGALAVPTWIVLPYAADPRWMTKTSSSIWYPSVQLFRQAKVGDWQMTLAEVKQKLQNLLK